MLKLKLIVVSLFISCSLIAQLSNKSVGKTSIEGLNIKPQPFKWERDTKANTETVLDITSGVTYFIDYAAENITVDGDVSNMTAKGYVNKTKDGGLINTTIIKYANQTNDVCLFLVYNSAGKLTSFTVSK
jgi:hypothetical protein